MYDLNKDTDPALAEFINDYIEGTLDKTEQVVFEEYLSTDFELNTFIYRSMQGRQMLKNIYSVCAADDFEEKLARRIAADREKKAKNSVGIAST